MKVSLAVVVAWSTLMSVSCTVSSSGQAGGRARDVAPDGSASVSPTGMGPMRAGRRAGGSPLEQVSDAGTSGWDGPMTSSADAAPPAGSSDAQSPATTIDVDPVPAPPSDASPPPATTLVDAAPDPIATPDAALSPPPPRIVRAHNVTVKRISVGVVYAHRLEANQGTIEVSGKPLSDHELAAQIGPDDLKVEELIADVLYAHDLHADSVQIREAHISDLNVKAVAP
jgi:hypothetical protein